jgi:nicotinate-nucleotide adenylyltransferase
MRVGLLPGSFDPPHAGHVALARRARDAAQLDRILFYPNSFNAEKPGLAPLEHRRAMLGLLLDPGFMALTPESFSDRPNGAADYDFLSLIAAVPAFVGRACEVVMVRGSDYFSPTMIGRYPPALAAVPHVIGVRDPAHRAFDYSGLSAVTLIACEPQSSTEMRQGLRQDGAPHPEADPIRHYCRRHGLYLSNA